MRQNGRKSLASLAVAPVGVTTLERPSAPLDLTPEESDEWVAIVGAMPAEWFPRETHPLLRQYVRHTISARRVAQMIDAAMANPELDMKALEGLLAMQARETSALKAMAASMRLSQQASYSARGAGGEKSRRPTMARPWEAEE